MRAELDFSTPLNSIRFFSKILQPVHSLEDIVADANENSYDNAATHTFRGYDILRLGSLGDRCFLSTN